MFQSLRVALALIPNGQSRAKVPLAGSSSSAKGASPPTRPFLLEPLIGERGRDDNRGSKAMGNGQVEALQRLIRDREELELHREAEVRAIAHRLIQTHIGWHRRGIDIPKFYAALAEALMATRAAGAVGLHKRGGAHADLGERAPRRWPAAVTQKSQRDRNARDRDFSRRTAARVGGSGGRSS